MTKVKIKEAGIFLTLQDIQIELPDSSEWLGNYLEEIEDALCQEVGRILEIDRNKTIHGMIVEVGVDWWKKDVKK